MEQLPTDLVNMIYDFSGHWFCVICKSFCSGFGNNPQPVEKKGRCCDWCNTLIVIRVRCGLKPKRIYW